MSYSYVVWLMQRLLQWDNYTKTPDVNKSGFVQLN